MKSIPIKKMIHIPIPILIGNNQTQNTLPVITIIINGDSMIVMYNSNKINIRKLNSR